MKHSPKIDKMKHYSKKIKGEILTIVATCMELEKVMPNKVIQKEKKDEIKMMLFRQNIKKHKRSDNDH